MKRANKGKKETWSAISILGEEEKQRIRKGTNPRSTHTGLNINATLDGATKGDMRQDNKISQKLPRRSGGEKTDRQRQKTQKSPNRLKPIIRRKRSDNQKKRRGQAAEQNGQAARRQTSQPKKMHRKR